MENTKNKKKLIMILSSCAFIMFMMLHISVNVENEESSFYTNSTGLCLDSVSMSVGVNNAQANNTCRGCSDCFGWGGTCGSGNNHYCGTIQNVDSKEMIECYREHF